MSKQGDDEWQGQPDRCNAPFACCPNSGLLEPPGGGGGGTALPDFGRSIIPTLQMFAGIYGGFIGKSECGDFKFMGIACNPQSL